MVLFGNISDKVIAFPKRGKDVDAGGAGSSGGSGGSGGNGGSGGSGGGKKPSNRRSSRSGGSERSLGALASVPAQIMVPRLMVICTVALLVGIGLLMIYSSSSIVALKKFGDPEHYLKNQAIYVAIGLICLIVVSRIPYQIYRSLAIWFFWALTVALLLWTIAKGLDAKGASRWIALGPFSLQPSEFAKIVLLLLTANLIARYRDGEYDLRSFLMIMGLGVVFPVALIFIQPDLGTTIIVLSTVIMMLYLSGMPVRYILYGLGALAVLGALAILLKPYRMRRFLTVWNPWADPMGAGYQPIQGMYAFGSGGLFGVGLGNSRQKFLYLPEAHTDFIYAIIGEELGLIGTIAVLLLFVILVYAGLRIAAGSRDFLGKLIAGGVTGVIGVQAVINMLCVVGFFPVTGKPLPFLSYGGSSIITSLILAGLLLSVSRQSSAPTEADRRRDSLRVLTMDDNGVNGSARLRPSDKRRR